MEGRGKVNQYDPRKTFGRSSVFSINLANGVTPFLLVLDNVVFASRLYRLVRSVIVECVLAWYRPTRFEFETLSPDQQDHILNGGLLSAPLALALRRQLPDDPVEATWDFETFQTWALTAYGRRIPADPPTPEEVMDTPQVPVCSHCGKPATCYGSYEGIHALGCDDCCGHGNEDGWCEDLYPNVVEKPLDPACDPGPMSHL